MWNIAEGVNVVRNIESSVRELGYHTCLGGGVLHKGESKKDLDIFILPLLDRDETAKHEDLLIYLSATFGILEKIVDDEYGLPNSATVCDQRKVIFQDKRIDFFIYYR